MRSVIRLWIANRSRVALPPPRSPCAKCSARAQASSAAGNRCSACTRASLPVSATATRSACNSISRDRARCASSSRPKAGSISERIDQISSRTGASTTLSPTPASHSRASVSSNLSRRASNWPAICCATQTQRPTLIERWAKWPNSCASTARSSPSVSALTRARPISRFFAGATNKVPRDSS